ncbi:Ig-like domain-containing protein [Herbiconiux sp. CPCC 203407]|uniref:Ig-like domain-containing protein n=1 Tax=Herbiconiux oxytropis TaxID=2970915 RepID=A0AA41XJE9_9MICO|nr:Ig-like domain-containing protein [Herbiconiux oxytropis]MCS5722447.1 Ig-like domain-containing protein [Herbiconiux oxytropis]MCS5727620.1 Ig-like domain-containing protein [Herbiconiux oxytropis]
MRHTSKPSRWRVAIIATAALAASTLPVLAAPAGPASAMQIDCSYSPGLKEFIDGGGVPGTKCSGGGGTGTGSGTSTGSGSGSGGSGSSGGTNCQPHQQYLPPYFIQDATRHDSTSYSTYLDDGGHTSTTTVRHYLNNRLSGSLQIFRQFRDGRTSWVLIYSLFQKGTLSQAIYASGMPCGTGYTYVDPVKAPAPSGAGDVREHLVSPGLPTTPLLGQVETRGSMTPIPGTGDEYFVRVDVTNPAGRALTPVDVETGFGDGFDLVSIASIPSDAECDVTARALEQCSVAVAGGQTKSFLFTAKAKPGTPADAELPVTVANLGVVMTELEYVEGATRERRMTRPVTNLYKLTRPAPFAPVVTPDTPVCSAEAAGGPTALPGGSDNQNVIAGQVTKLVKHCSNATGLPMKSSALHGTTTMDAYGWVSYTPDTGYRGPDTVSVLTVNPETKAESAPAAIAVTVVAPAEATADAYTVSSDTTLTSPSSLLDNDRVPPTDGWMIQQGTTPPAHGTLELDARTGRFTYTPVAGYVGADSFRYRLSGPDGAVSNVVAVEFTVTAP